MAEPVQPNVPLGKEGVPFRMPRPPFWMIVSFMLLVVITWVPLALIALARTSTSRQPRIHIFQDMDVQPRFEAQDTNPLFADGRSMRPRLPGTVPFGGLNEDDHLYRGFREVRDEVSGELRVAYYEGMPEGVEVTEAFVKRGQVMYNTYCGLCHGRDGYGNGPIMARAEELGIGWLSQNLHKTEESGELTYGESLYSDGRLFNTITNGKGTMRGYRYQIKVADRWAIVAYVRALQLSQRAKLGDLPADLRDKVR